MNAVSIAFAVLPKVYAYIDTDLNKRYSLLEPFNITLKEPVPCTFDCDTLHIEGNGLQVIPYLSTAKNAKCDGNTLVPEEVLGIKTVVGSLVHDPLYANLPQIAKTFRWSLDKTRKWADGIYGNIELELARRESSWAVRKIGIGWAHVSYVGLRIFGGIGRATYRLGALALIGVSLVACSGASGGCMGDVIEPDFVVPAYQQEASKVTTEKEVAAEISKYTNTINKVLNKVVK